MQPVSRLEQNSRLDGVVSAGQRVARLIPPGKVRDALNGVSFRLAGGANHAEEVPHLVKPGWHYLMTSADLPEGTPVHHMLGEVPVVAIRAGGTVHVLADRCSHMSGPLSDGKLADGCLTCPWHGSVFRIADGSVVHGPATTPQPAFQTREVGGAIQICLPGAG